MSLFDATVDLNPHQIEAAPFALAPVPLPMTDSLGALEIEALSAVASGEPT
jgi:hypothetical protein